MRLIRFDNYAQVPGWRGGSKQIEIARRLCSKEGMAGARLRRVFRDKNAPEFSGAHVWTFF